MVRMAITERRAKIVYQSGGHRPSRLKNGCNSKKDCNTYIGGRIPSRLGKFRLGKYSGPGKKNMALHSLAWPGISGH